MIHPCYGLPCHSADPKSELWCAGCHEALRLENNAAFERCTELIERLVARYEQMSITSARENNDLKSANETLTRELLDTKRLLVTTAKSEDALMKQLARAVDLLDGFLEWTEGDDLTVSKSTRVFLASLEDSTSAKRCAC